jgi:predicted metal-dependent phosphoesterase TrpH
MRVELHCHSTASDGAEAPSAVGRKIADLGVALFSLTDHDTCAGWAAASAALGPGTIGVGGVELSAVEAGRTVHLLAYDAARDGRWDLLGEDLAAQAAARRVRMRDMIARLVQRGVQVTWEDVIAEAGEEAGILGRPHLARALVKRRAVSSVSEAFDRYLGDGGRIASPLARIGVDRALDLAATVGARVSLAHPHTLGPVICADLLRRYGERGLSGLEAAYGGYAARDRAEWTAMAASFGAVVTGGSDYHGAELGGGPGRPGVELEDPHAGRLLEWLGVG